MRHIEKTSEGTVTFDEVSGLRIFDGNGHELAAAMLPPKLAVCLARDLLKYGSSKVQDV